MADVTLPQLGETVTEGTITQWFKAVGDEVAEDEPLFEVSTDKVDTEVPSPVSGTLTGDPRRGGRDGRGRHGHRRRRRWRIGGTGGSSSGRSRPSRRPNPSRAPPAAPDARARTCSAGCSCALSDPGSRR